MTRRRIKLSIIGPLVAGSVLTLTLVMLTVVGIRAGNAQAQQGTTDNERAKLATSAKLLFNPLYNLDETTLRNMLDTLLEDTNTVYVAVRNTSGQIVVEATSDWMPNEQLNAELSALALDQRGIVHRKIGQHLVLCGPIAVGVQQIGTLTIVADSTPSQVSVGAYGTMLAVSVVLIVGATLALAVAARYATAPLRALAAAANEIGQGDLDTPVPVRGLEETTALGTAMEHMRSELKELYANLERQAATRERLTRRLQVAAEVIQTATVELDVSALLQRAVRLISERFGFYHASIHLLDETGEWVMMQAASSSGGQRILEGGLRLRVGESSIVGYVTKRGTPYIVSDVETDPIHLPHPDLPNTRSELALPLQARGEILGALDVQSQMNNAFTDEDVDVLQILGNQVALAISNARLFQQAQKNLETAQRAYGEISARGWSETLQARPDRGYYCDADSIVPITEHFVVREEEGLAAIDVPITVRGQVIGTIRAYKHSDAGNWTPEEATLMETLAEQLNVALESARLYQSTQYRAAHERLVSGITAHIRESLDVETVTQRAARELGRALEADTVTIRLGTVEQLLHEA